MGDEQLLKFCKIIKELKDKLKCSICLDVIQDVAELECGHKFCHGCFSQFKSNQKHASCPLCKAIARRRSPIYKDDFANKLGSYVSKVYDTFRKVYSCEVEELVSCKSSVKSKSNSHNSKHIKRDTEKPSTSINKLNDKSSRISPTNDAFDMLIKGLPHKDKLVVNKKGTKEIYHHKKEPKKTVPDYKILDFDDYENRARVLKWLNDTRNKFDRLTQTQNFEEGNSDGIPSDDLVSVSQVKQKGCDRLRNILRHRSRAKSLDIEVKKIKVKNRYSDGSYRDKPDNYIIEDVNTEEENIVKKVEEDVLLNIIEDRYLDKIESELQNNSINQETVHKSVVETTQPSTSGWDRIKHVTKTIRKMEKVPKKLDITIKSTQISNVLAEKKENIKASTRYSQSKRIARTPQPDENQSVSGESKKGEFVEKCLKIVLQRIEVENHLSFGNENSMEVTEIVPKVDDVKAKHSPVEENEKIMMNKNSKVYDLNALETYISENIEVIEKENSFNDTNTNSLPKDVELEYENCSNKENNENIVNVIPNKEKVVILETIILKNNSANNIKDVNMDEDPYLLPTQKLNISDDSKSKKINVPNENNPFIYLTQDIPNDQYPQDVFLKPTQKSENLIVHSYDDIMEEKNLAMAEELLKGLQIDLKYCQAIINIGTVEDRLAKMMGSVIKLMALIVGRNSEYVAVHRKKCIDEEIQTVFESQTKQMQTEFQSVDKQVQTELVSEDKLDISSKEIAEQIDNSSKSLIQNTKNALKTLLSGSGTDKTKQTQTEFQSIDEEVQTELVPEDKLGISSKEITEQIDSSSKRLTQNTKNALRSSLSGSVTDKTVKQTLTKPQTQNECFSATLDNLYFETQDITKNMSNLEMPCERGAQVTVPMQKVLQKHTSNNVSEKIDQTAAKSNENNSLLVCSVDSRTKVNKKLRYQENTSCKRNLSDSDSDEIIKPKKRCNRFIRDDLSVAFEDNTETEQLHGKDNVLEELSLESDGIDYDEYLDKVMKKYEDNGNLVSTPRKEEKCDLQQSGRNNSKVRGASPKSNKESDLDDNLIDCDEINKRINENVKKLSEQNKTINKNKTDSQSSSKSFRNNDLSVKEIIDIREAKLFETESSDIIAETESLEPVPKRARKELFNVAFDREKSQDLHVDENLKNDEVCPELNDSVDDAEFENIQIATSAEKSQHTPVAQEAKDEDLFSDDDDDIVETTPQKESSFIEKRSQRSNYTLPLPLTDNPLKSVENLDDMDFAPLLPPPDFQDTPQQNDDSSHQITVLENDYTLTNNQQSLTPDELSQFIKCDDTMNRSKVRMALFKKDHIQSSTAQKLSQLNVSISKVHSTPPARKEDSDQLLVFSPIENLIERAQVATHTPLTNVSKQSVRKQNILTSTPKQKSIWNYVTSQHSDCEPVKSKPCIACTRLSKEKTQSVSLLTNRKLATYSQVFDKSVTHMIVTVDDGNRIKDYTMKFVAGVAAGIWILRYEWVQECLNTNSIVPEEPYEVLDDTGMPGPKTARLTRDKNPLFEGFKFYCADSLFSTTRADVEEVIRMLGGKPVPTLEKLSERDGRISLIITEGRSTQDFEVYEKWLELYKTVTVDIEWLSKSVGRYKLLSIRPYIWCSDDHLDDLGYPPHLTEVVQSSTSEQY